MEYDIFDPFDAVRFGWNCLNINIRFFAVLMIIVAALYSLPFLMQIILFGFFTPSGFFSGAMHLILAILPSFLLPIFSILIYIMLDMGLLKIALGFRDNKNPEIEDLFRGYPLLIKYLAASIIYFLMIFAPPFFLSFSGVILAGDTLGLAISYILLILSFIVVIVLFIKYQFYGYLIIDRGLGAIESLKESAKLTRGAEKNLLLFWLVVYCGFALIMLPIGALVLAPHAILAGLVSEKLLTFFTMTINLGISLISFVVIVPIIKLATADIFRRLEEWSAAAPDLPSVQPAGGEEADGE